MSKEWGSNFAARSSAPLRVSVEELRTGWEVVSSTQGADWYLCDPPRAALGRRTPPQHHITVLIRGGTDIELSLPAANHTWGTRRSALKPGGWSRAGAMFWTPGSPHLKALSTFPNPNHKVNNAPRMTVGEPLTEWYIFTNGALMNPLWLWVIFIRIEEFSGTRMWLAWRRKSCKDDSLLLCVGLPGMPWPHFRSFTITIPVNVWSSQLADNKIHLK